jgi:hypothetical protein
VTRITRVLSDLREESDHRICPTFTFRNSHGSARL